MTAPHDWRLDLLHGFALFAMAVDFLGGASWLSMVTAGNGLLISLAGAFISIVGLVVGLVNGAIALKEGLHVARAQLLRRALALYKLNGALTRIFSSGVLLLHLPVTKKLPIDNLSNLEYKIMAPYLSIHLSMIPWMPAFLLLTTLGGLWLVAPSAGGLLCKPLRATRILRKS